MESVADPVQLFEDAAEGFYRQTRMVAAIKSMREKPGERDGLKPRLQIAVYSVATLGALPRGSDQVIMTGLFNSGIYPINTP